jgi:CBS-domain-containing membrane protein
MSQTRRHGETIPITPADWAQMTVADVMTNFVVVTPEYTPVAEVAGQLLDHRVGALPVVDCRRRVIGVISAADLVIDGPAAASVRSGPAGWRAT